MRPVDIKTAAHQLIEQLDHPTWAELAYRAAMRASIEQGLEDSDAGRTIPVEGVRKEFGLDE